MDQMICSLCGSPLTLESASACTSCPLHSACAFVCCPTCGYTMVSPERSGLARGAVRLVRVLRRFVPRAVGHTGEGLYTLADAPVATDLRIVACGALAQEHRDWLQAYGVQPGHCVRVLQHRPVTIVQAGQDELALERPIAQAVQVEAVAGTAPVGELADRR